MYFQVGLAITLYRGPYADIGDTGPGLAVDLDVDQVDPGKRHATALELYVGGGRTQLPGQFLAVQNATGYPVRAPEQAFGEGRIEFSRQDLRIVEFGQGHADREYLVRLGGHHGGAGAS